MGTLSDEMWDEICVDTLARTIWGEARGEGNEGMAAVACVVMNRVRVAKDRGNYWWGNDVVFVCQKPYQFSCWNRSDVNYQKIVSVTEEDRAYARAVCIAEEAIDGVAPDLTNGATHYHAKSVSPYWSKGLTPVFDLGNHLFYRLIEV